MLFIDLIGSTSLAERLDPEPLRVLMDRYYLVCTRGVGDHGGVIEKFIGDAIMAVFGVPLAHEDDAARAVRAALHITEAVRGLGMGLEVHSGIFSGEVVVAEIPGGDLRVVGDAVNTAARLQSAAGPGEILIGRSVALAVRDQVESRPVPPLRLKGKAGSVPAWTVTGLRSGPVERPMAGFVGRSDELDRLRDAFGRIVRQRECCVVTVLGAPGLGKTRLVREFLSGLPAGDALVLSGQCHSYGRGITYRPIAEMVDPLDLPEVLRHRPDRNRIIQGLAARSSVEEIAWSMRSLLEDLATRRPVIVVCDDLHWAEPTLLDLLEALMADLAGLPIMLILLARPELLEIRPAWGTGHGHAITIEPPPLTAEQLDLLLTRLAGDVVALADDDVLARVAVASGGNPLFAELMVDMLAEGEETIPPTVQAMLTARIDRLPSAERAVLERAAVFGQRFSKQGLALLGATSGEPIVQVVRRRLVERAGGAGAFRFAQALTRDVVYTMTPKAQRRDWHLTIADWLTDQDEVAYHLEAACLLSMEVSPGDPANAGLGRRAARQLGEAGTQSLARKDLPAATGLLERALALLPPTDPERRSLVIRLCDAFVALSRREKAMTILDANEQAFAGDERGRRILEIQRRLLALRYGPADFAELAAACDRLEARLAGDPEDHLGWCRAHQLRALSWLLPGQVGRAEESMRAAVARARRLTDRHEEERLLIAYCELAQWSPAPVETGLALCADLTRRFAGDRALLVMVMLTRSRLLALRGDLTTARELLDDALQHVEDLHLKLARVAVSQVRALVESLAGEHATAERLYGTAARDLLAMGHRTVAGTLQVYAARERVRAGAPTADVIEELPTGRLELPAELAAACLYARAGSREHADAALALLDRTDDPCVRGDALGELALGWYEQDRPQAAAEAAEQAMALYRARGATLAAERLAGRLDSRRPA